MIKIASSKQPDLSTLVPEKRAELTTEGGLDVRSGKKTMREAIKSLHGSGIRVSLFINPSVDDVEISKEIGADMVEIHTGAYANEKGGKQNAELARVIQAIEKAKDVGLEPNAGHGLNYFNVVRIAEIEEVRGLYIGHSIISRAVLVGIERAVREMKELISSARR
jgi:pyridoxine 5-phosphate synthase